ncbi:MAG: ABC transporter ATP-binding protein [Candidatus Omnitrophica bacterium]|nr:ABC transporter ATP-binding protein [Candidatus Omnitrophota bacterium]MCM8831575.1 ABC transporter ATP-binding protein [Candidatus Omnitrophota bacterium]
MEILRLEKISLKIEGRQILKDLNLSVKEGTIHSILGSNAAGKSSLAYLIMGCSDYFAQKGKIYFKGEDISNFSLSKRAKMGITLAWQEPARFEGLTVRDYIATGIKEKDEILIKKVLQEVLLDPKDYLDREVDKSLSGGERKRIELAAVFAMKPKLAILDEPDSGIDILALDNIVDMIKKLKKYGTTVLLITHRQEVAEIADMTSLMCSGCIVKEGSPQKMSKYFKEKCIPCPTKNFFKQKDE